MGTHPIFESDFDCLTDMPKERKRSWDGDINEDDLLNEDTDKKSDDGDQDIEDMLLLDHDPDDLLNEDSEKDVAADELLLSPHDDEFGEELDKSASEPPPPKQIKLDKSVDESGVDPLDKLDYDESDDEKDKEEEEKKKMA